MELLKTLVIWFTANGPAVAGAILGLLSVAETVVRLTPTKKDDTAVERIGTFIRKLFDMLGVPNVNANGGVHPSVADKAAAQAPAVEEKKAA